MIRIKTREEIDGIRSSCKLLARCLAELEPLIRPGVTGRHLNDFVENFIRKNHAEPAFSKYGGFPTAACISVNDVVIHGVPGSSPLEAGDLVGVDIGLVLNGFFSDMAKTFGVGVVDAADRLLMNDTRASLDLGIGAIKLNGRINDIGKAVSGYLKPKGYGVVYEYCGHGVGLAVHEEPQISNDYPQAGPNPRVKAGMVLAIEPMVSRGSPRVKTDKIDGWSVRSFDGENTAHFEHTVAVLESGVEVLTVL